MKKDFFKNKIYVLFLYIQRLFRMSNLYKNIIIPLLILSLTLFLSSFRKIYAQNNKTFTVVIDPGHGGKDSGTRGTGRTPISEKDVVLSVGKKVRDLLKKHSDIKVVMTRSSDKFLELRERANLANKIKADVFVSIHCNASSNPNAKGSETYVLGVHRNKDNLEVAKRENAVILLEEDYEMHYEGFDPNAPETFIGLELLQEEFLEQSILLASMVQREFEKRVPTRNRSVQQAGFAVLRLTYMPSVLTEIGFLSNPKEEKFLHSEEGQNQIALSIANAILNYKKIIEQNSVTPETLNLENSPEPSQSETSGQPTGQTENTSPENHAQEAFFSVQIQSSSKKIPLKPDRFNGLSNIFSKKMGKTYKYFYGKTTSLDQAKKLLRTAKKAGYRDAFIVGFINEKRVSVAKIIKHLAKNR